MPRPVPGLVTAAQALASALSEARDLSAILKLAESVGAAERAAILGRALQRSCVLRDHIDTAERASR